MMTLVTTCILLVTQTPAWTSARVDWLADIPAISVHCVSGGNLASEPLPDAQTRVCDCPVKRGLLPTVCETIVIQSDMATAAGCLVSYPLSVTSTAQKPIRWKTLQAR